MKRNDAVEVYIHIYLLSVYKDKNVPTPFKEDFGRSVKDESSYAAKEDHIYMDAMGFGMGCCCLQLTFQACNIEEARTLYDQLTPLCPIMVSNTRKNYYAPFINSENMELAYSFAHTLQNISLTFDSWL